MGIVLPCIAIQVPITSLRQFSKGRPGLKKPLQRMIATTDG